MLKYILVDIKNIRTFINVCRILNPKNKILQVIRIMKETARLNIFAKHALILKCFAAASTYLFTLLLTKTMTVSGFGVVATILNVVVLSVTVSLYGQGFIIQKFGSHYNGKRAVNELRMLYGFSLVRSFFGFIAMLILCQIIIYLYFNEVYSGNTYYIYAMATILIPIMGLLELQTYIARSHHLIPLAVIPKEIIWRLLVGLAVIVAISLSGESNVSAEFVVVLLILSGLIVLVFQYLALKRKQVEPKFSFENSDDLVVWKKASVPFWITSTSAILFTNIDVVIVSMYFGTEPAALYFVANRMSILLSFFHISFNFVSAPLISEYYADKNYKAIRNVVKGAVTRSFYPTLILGVVLIIIAPHLLGIFGESYKEGVGVMTVLVIASILNSAFGSPDILLIMCGYDRECMFSTIFSMIFGLGVILISGFLAGVLGVSVGVLLALVFRKYLYWSQARKLLLIRTDILKYI